MCKRRDRSSCAGQCGGQQGLDASGASRQAVEAAEAITGPAETCPPHCRVEAFGVMLLLDIEFYLDTECMRACKQRDHVCIINSRRWPHLQWWSKDPAHRAPDTALARGPTSRVLHSDPYPPSTPSIRIEHRAPSVAHSDASRPGPPESRLALVMVGGWASRSWKVQGRWSGGIHGRGSEPRGRLQRSSSAEHASWWWLWIAWWSTAGRRGRREIKRRCAGRCERKEEEPRERARAPASGT